MRILETALPFVLFLPACFALNSAPIPAAMTAQEKAAMADAVRAETLHAWEGTKKYVWGPDEFHPLTKKPFDWYGHTLLMTPVDALDTLILMGLKPQADEARQLIDTKLDLNQDIYVKDFEITIRLLGGLLSNYEMTGA